MKKNNVHLNRRAVQNLALIAVLVFLIIFFYIQNPRFLASRNLYNIPRQILPTIIMGCAMTLVINSGAIDLSVGGLMALAAIVFGKLVTFGVNVWAALFFTLCLGMLVGSISTFLIHKLKLPAIMATIAMWVICSGTSYALIRAIPITDTRLKPIFLLNSTSFFDKKVPLALFIILGVVLLFLFLEKKTVLGKYALAIGGNENAARLSGINIPSIHWVLFALSGIMAAFSGIWQVARIGSADPNIGIGMEFQVIAGCILGGVNIKGGSGTISGMLIGTLILVVLMNGMGMMGFNPYYQQVATGVVILVAVMINYFVSVQSRRRAVRGSVKPAHQAVD
jgi:ribose/xylose/arabinose/galactoside ABC-type transport system permease subunit